jgi:proliferating cell nuclear antigen
MKLSLAEPKYLKESISIISELVTEGKFKISSNAIELVAMDPANVAMVIFKLLSSAFTEYKVEKDIEIGINLNNLKQILRRAKPADILTLEMEENKLKIELKSNNVRTFYLPTIDLEDKEQKIPQLDFPISITTQSSIFNEVIEDADIVAESLSLEMEGGKFVVRAAGDLSHAKIEINESDATKIKADTQDNVKAKYSLEYLKKMMDGCKLSDEVTLSFNKDYPLRLDYTAVDRVQLSFILAPRVENE